MNQRVSVARYTTALPHPAKAVALTGGAQPATRRQLYGRPGATPGSQIVVRLPSPNDAPAGAAEPQVEMRSPVERLWPVESVRRGDSTAEPVRWAPALFRLDGLSRQLLGPQVEELPIPEDQATGEALTGPWQGEQWAEGQPLPEGQPVFHDLVGDLARRRHDDCTWWGKVRKMLLRDPCGDIGIGHERVAFAPFFIDLSQPLGNSLRFRFDLAYNIQSPDRAEFIYGQQRGFNSRVDYQDIRTNLEFGGPKFSTATEIPIRILDPSSSPNTAGLGDMNLTIKTVWVDGKRWQITQLMRTQFNTGSVNSGLGTGHIAMEPGVLLRYRSNDELYWHGQLKYRFPLGGDPVHAGPGDAVGSWAQSLVV